MKLEIGTYEIPDDCTCIYSKRKVIVKKKRKIPEPNVKHCRDCIHQKIGRKTLKNQWYDSAYCEKRQKPGTGCYYCAPDIRIACYMFEEKK